MCEVLAGLGQAKVGNTRTDRVPGNMAWAAPWVDVSPLGESRGGTPEGEPSPLGRRRTPTGAEEDRAPSGVLLPYYFIRHCEARRAEAIQKGREERLDCFVAIAPRNDDSETGGVKDTNEGTTTLGVLFLPRVRASHVRDLTLRRKKSRPRMRECARFL